MRSTFLSLVLACSAASMAQTTVNNDVMFAFQGFAASSTLKLTLDGTETVNGRGKRVRVVTNYLTSSTASGTVLGLIEIVETQDGKLTQRTVGDGQTLWIYNSKHNEYMAVPYGEAGSNNYFAKLADGFGSQIEGFGAYPARFLRDILYRRDSMGSAGATFRNWTPGFAPNVWMFGSGSHPDPINPTRTYNPDPTRYFLNYANGAAPSRSLTFEFEQGSTQFELIKAYGSELVPLGRMNKLIDWQLSFEKSGLTFVPGTFSFIPPTNSRAIPAPKIGF